MDNLTQYKIMESLNSTKENLWAKSIGTFSNYQKTIQHQKVLKKNYPKFFEAISKFCKAIESWEEVGSFSFFFDSNTEWYDRVSMLWQYASVELTISLARFYADFSVAGWVNTNLLNIFDKNKFFEFDWDVQRISHELRTANVLIFDFNDLQYLSKNEVQKFFNVTNSLISQRKNGIKTFDIFIWNSDIKDIIGEAFSQYVNIQTTSFDLLK